MNPTYRPDAPRSAEAAAFADVMRSVLHTRPDSPVDEPLALETWTAVDGYTWQWSTSRGSWTVAAGAVLDPRPRLRGPAGEWTIDRYDEAAARELVALLRLAGAIPPPPAERDPDQPANPEAWERRPGPVIDQNGWAYELPGPPAAALARYWRPGTDPFPPGCVDPPRPGDSYVAVALIAGARPLQALLLAGAQAQIDPGQPTLMPVLADDGTTIVVHLAPIPDALDTDQPDHATAVAVIQAHRAAAHPAGDPDADLALGPDDPAIARAVAAEAAAGPPGRAVGTAQVPGANHPDPLNTAEFAARRAASGNMPLD